MSAGIQHLLKGGRESNRVGEARVDKIETDRFNSIVERISGVNPSKLAAEASGKKMVESPSVAPPTPPQQSMASWGSGPAHQLAAQRPDAHVNFLAEKVAMLEHRLARYETFDGADNDVVSTTNTPAKKLNRGADSSAMGSNVIRKKNAKTKDPVDGKPDGPPTQKQPEAQMAGEHVNILGISMTEWREMTGLKAPPVDLTARPPIAESYEDEIEETAAVRSALRDIGVPAKEPMPPPSDPAKRAKVGMKPLSSKGGSTPDSRSALSGISAMHARRRAADEEIEHQLWANFLEGFESHPEEFAAFVEAADEAGDEDALIAIGELEDEFVEALSYYMEGDAAAKETIADFLKRGGSVKKLPTRHARGYVPAGMKVKGGAAQQFGHQEPKKASDADPANTLKKQGVRVAAGKAEDIDALWSQWLEERGLSVETFDALVEAIETDEDLETLETLQAMFMAEMKVGDTVAVDSILNKDTKIKPADNSAGTAHPLIKKMAALRKMTQPKVEDDEAFECDDDGNGHPDMKHPAWAKAMKKFKKSGRKS